MTEKWFNSYMLHFKYTICALELEMCFHVNRDSFLRYTYFWSDLK